jgi:cytidylate kinase
MKESVPQEPKIVAAAERQMYAWAAKSELVNRTIRDRDESLAASRCLNYVTISREAGAGGSEIGKALAERLGWNLFDKNLLDQIADRFHVCRRMLELVDETESSWVYDVLGTWMDCQIVPHEKYVSLLSRVVLAAAHGEHAVFVGRGAQFLLPRRQLLAVRLVASPKYRVRQIMERTGSNENDARRLVKETDRGRRQFVERFFHHDVADPHCFDLVINVELCGREGAVNEILSALKSHASKP